MLESVFWMAVWGLAAQQASVAVLHRGIPQISESQSDSETAKELKNDFPPFSELNGIKV
jgi:hypothetical protein